MTSIYVHLPYCKSKCIYCDFVVETKPDEHKRRDYITALLKEINYYLSQQEEVPLPLTKGRGDKFQKELKTLYFGGGTPALFSASEIKQIIDAIAQYYQMTRDTEITFEANPDGMESNVAEYQGVGVNRLSIGIQSLQSNELKRLSRIHSPGKAIEFVNEAAKSGFDNISIDLMYGIPEQTQESWEKTLDIAMKLPIQHVSMYGLKVEESTKLASVLKQGRMTLPPDDDTVDWYELAIQKLKQYGFNQYELSNFARENCESNHNINYWQNNNFWGFGVGAHGYVNAIRYENTNNLNAYLNNPTQRNSEHTVTRSESLENFLIFGLRQTHGVSLDEISTTYGADVAENVQVHLKQFSDLGLLKIQGAQMALTPHAYSISNEIFERCLNLPFAIDS